MNADHCCECDQPIDITKRVYKGKGGLPRCAVCQVLAECRLEIVRITKLAEVLESAERERGGAS